MNKNLYIQNIVEMSNAEFDEFIAENKEPEVTEESWQDLLKTVLAPGVYFNPVQSEEVDTINIGAILPRNRAKIFMKAAVRRQEQEEAVMALASLSDADFDFVDTMYASGKTLTYEEMRAFYSKYTVDKIMAIDERIKKELYEYKFGKKEYNRTR